MRAINEIGKIYSTNDYSIFHALVGNRPVVRARAAKIAASIKSNGYILNPIIVNDKYEVLDGQGRLEALKELDMPVPFIVVHGGIKECIALNASNTNWSMLDYINTYADQGDENYIRLRNLISDHTGLGYKVCAAIACGNVEVNNRAIKAGKLSLGVDKYTSAEEICGYLDDLSGCIKLMSGRKDLMCFALGFAYQCEDCKPERMRQLFKQNFREITPPASMEMALNELSRIYNRGTGLRKTDYIYLWESYQKCMSGKYSWYQAKWGKRHTGFEGGNT